MIFVGQDGLELGSASPVTVQADVTDAAAPPSSRGISTAKGDMLAELASKYGCDFERDPPAQ